MGWRYSSYLLVIYYQNVKSYGAWMLTVLSNRIGDVVLLMAIVWIINFGSWSFIYYLEILSGSVEMELISFLVVLAAITKSAQIPFSSWLPAAMAAPTPVSALVHSSTLVTAGVYLLIRFRPSSSVSAQTCHGVTFTFAFMNSRWNLNPQLLWRVKSKKPRCNDTKSMNRG